MSKQNEYTVVLWNLIWLNFNAYPSTGQKWHGLSNNTIFNDFQWRLSSGGTGYWAKGLKPTQMLPKPTQTQQTPAKTNSSSEVPHHQFTIIAVNVMWSLDHHSLSEALSEYCESPHLLIGPTTQIIAVINEWTANLRESFLPTYQLGSTDFFEHQRNNLVIICHLMLRKKHKFLL